MPKFELKENIHLYNNIRITLCLVYELGSVRIELEMGRKGNEREREQKLTGHCIGHLCLLSCGSEMQRALAYAITERNIQQRERTFPEEITENENMQPPTTTYERIY